MALNILKDAFTYSLLFWCSNIFGYHFPSIARYLPENPVILDCGAHAGDSSIKLLKHYPDATIIAVEADPDLFILLQQKTKEFSQIYVFHQALTNYNGEIPFYENREKAICSAQGSIFPPSKDLWYWPDIKLNTVPTLVPCQTLDSFCQFNEIEKCDFLFLDMQGAELGMLIHSPVTLSKVSVILTEVLYEKIYENCPLYSELKQFLESQGFEELDHKVMHSSFGDALFVRK